MVIEWTPWFDAPMHRRLELFSVGFIVFCEIALGPIAIAAILLLIVISVSISIQLNSIEFNRISSKKFRCDSLIIR